MLITPTAATPAHARAGVVFSDQAGRSTLRARAIPVDPSTAAQWQQRPAFRRGREGWPGLTSTQRSAWRTAGATRGPAGHELFTAVASLRRRLALPDEPDALDAAQVAPLVSIDAAAVASGDTLAIQFEAEASTLPRRVAFTVAGPCGPDAFPRLNERLWAFAGLVPADPSPQTYVIDGPSPRPLTSGQLIGLGATTVDERNRYAIQLLDFLGVLP